MRFGVYLPPFGELADPLVLGEMGALAEEVGFDGVFVWDHIARPARDLAVADVWVALAAVALKTDRVLLGPLVTPISRRRPQKLARETVTLHRLSRGRLVLGVGLGSNSAGELTRFGEIDDDAARAERLDEGLELLTQLWSGEEVNYAGHHFVASGVRFLPRPEPSIPIWVAARSAKPALMRRAARHDGICPETTIDGLREMLTRIEAERGTLDGYDVVVRGAPGDDPAPWAAAGATWWLVHVPEMANAVEAEAVIRLGPSTGTAEADRGGGTPTS